MSIFVTGGNAGIGLALCKQLATEHTDIIKTVFLGSRSLERGQQAVTEIEEYIKSTKFNSNAAKVVLIQCDTASDESVKKAAAEVVKNMTSVSDLYAIVNNAGTGLQHGVTDEDIMNVNLHGPRRVVEAFLPLLRDNGRIVNVGSGAGPKFVESLDVSDQNQLAFKTKLCKLSDPLTISEIFNQYGGLSNYKSVLTQGKGMGSYGLSKALLSAYTMNLVTSTETPLINEKNICVSCISPGFIDTNMVKGWGATKPPSEGTVSIRHCLFYKEVDNEKLGNGWYYGSDGVRSPLHYMRDPGTEAYDGEEPTFG